MSNRSIKYDVTLALLKIYYSEHTYNLSMSKEELYENRFIAILRHIADYQKH